MNKVEVIIEVSLIATEDFYDYRPSNKWRINGW